MMPPSTELFSAGSIVIGSEARFTVMLKSPSLAVSSVAASSLVSSSAASSAVPSVLAALSSFAVVLLFPQPANIDTVNVAANRIDKTFFFILSSLLFLLLINKVILPANPLYYPVVFSSTVPADGMPPSGLFRTL